MPYALGIDLGIRFTNAALSRQGDEERAEVLYLGESEPSLPCVVHENADGELVVGIGPGDATHLSAAGFTGRIGDEPTVTVGSRTFTPQDLATQVVDEVAERATEQEGEEPEVIVVTHPSSWDDRRKALLLLALRRMGRRDVRLLAEPQAAAARFSAVSQHGVRVGGTLGVLDVDRGTVDLVERTSPTVFELVGEPHAVRTTDGDGPPVDVDEDMLSTALSAGLGDSGLDALVVLGGDPDVPGVADGLSEVVTCPVVVEPDPTATIPLGAALAGWTPMPWTSRDAAEVSFADAVAHALYDAWLDLPPGQRPALGPANVAADAWAGVESDPAPVPRAVRLSAHPVVRGAALGVLTLALAGGIALPVSAWLQDGAGVVQLESVGADAAGRAGASGPAAATDPSPGGPPSRVADPAGSATAAPSGTPARLAVRTGAPGSPSRSGPVPGSVVPGTGAPWSLAQPSAATGVVGPVGAFLTPAALAAGGPTDPVVTSGGTLPGTAAPGLQPAVPTTSPPGTGPTPTSPAPDPTTPPAPPPTPTPAPLPPAPTEPAPTEPAPTEPAPEPTEPPGTSPGGGPPGGTPPGRGKPVAP